MGADRHIKSWS